MNNPPLLSRPVDTRSRVKDTKGKSKLVTLLSPAKERKASHELVKSNAITLINVKTLVKVSQKLLDR